jgi:hypothetical protein
MDEAELRIREPIRIVSRFASRLLNYAALAYVVGYCYQRTYYWALGAPWLIHHAPAISFLFCNEFVVLAVVTLFGMSFVIPPAQARELFNIPFLVVLSVGMFCGAYFTTRLNVFAGPVAAFLMVLSLARARIRVFNVNMTDNLSTGQRSTTVKTSGGEKIALWIVIVLVALTPFWMGAIQGASDSNPATTSLPRAVLKDKSQAYLILSTDITYYVSALSSNGNSAVRVVNVNDIYQISQ